jgi:hypothetical protein
LPRFTLATTIHAGGASKSIFRTAFKRLPGDGLPNLLRCLVGFWTNSAARLGPEGTGTVDLYRVKENRAFSSIRATC